MLLTPETIYMTSLRPKLMDRRKFIRNTGLILGGAALAGVGGSLISKCDNIRFRDDGSRLCGTNLVTWRRDGFYDVDKVLSRLIGYVNHISLVTSYSMRNISSGIIREDRDTPSLDSIAYAIQKIKNMGGTEIMLKPHINVEDGYRTFIYPDNFYNAYFKNFIYPLVEFAEENHVEQFCIGTELMFAAAMDQDSFRKGIKEIRKRFNGKLTFAAYNATASWVKFWDLLDFIGYDHYAPVNIESQNVEQMEQDLLQTSFMLESLAKDYSKKILFTEYGCTSLDGGSQMPTTDQRRDVKNKRINLDEQDNYLKAFYNSYWEKSWCMGGDLWCAYNPEEIEKESRDSDYYWFDKPVNATIEERYSTPAKSNLRF